MNTENTSPTHVYNANPATDALQFASGVSWGAVLAGATASAALSLILLLLGVGFGLSSVSPWSGEGIGAAALSVSTIVWITLMSLAASGVGGYMAGRLRTKWVSLHSDEVYFRDTAHGLLAWGISTLAMATLLASAAGSIIGAGAKAGTEVAGGITSAASTAAAGSAGAFVGQNGENTLNYFVDSLFRGEARPAVQDGSTRVQQGNEHAVREASGIFINALAEDGALPSDDLEHVARLVSQNTRLTQQQAEQRVTEIYDRSREKLRELDASVRETADAAKKASAYASLWFSVALLIGAFVASLAATVGGRQRGV